MSLAWAYLCRKQRKIMIQKLYINTNSKHAIPVIATLLAILTAVSPLATDTYLPAMPTMAKFFGVHISMIELSMSFYFIGVALGQFLGGPISDTFGRKKVALAGLLLFASSSLAVMLVTDVELLWFFRFTQAIGGGMASVVNMAFVRDWYSGSEIARISSLVSMIMMLAPLVAPLIGSVLMLSYGWHSIFVFLSSVAIFVFLIFLFVVPESRPKEAMTLRVTPKQFVESYFKVFSYKEVIFLVLCNSFAISGMFTFVVSSSFIYIEYFKIPVEKFPFFFGANVCLVIFLNFLNYRLVKHYHPTKLLFVGMLMLLISGIALGIASQFTGVYLYAIVIPIVFFMGSMGLMFPNIVALIIHRFPDIAGSANAVIGVSRFALSALVGFVAAYFHTSDLRSSCITMMACAVIAFVFYLFSRKYRTIES